jgi:hypothetical protein
MSIEFIGDYILGTELARILGLHQTYFYKAIDNEYFKIKRVYGQCYVQPCKRIIDLLNHGYVARTIEDGDDESNYEVVIVLSRKKIGFWR